MTSTPTERDASHRKYAHEIVPESSTDGDVPLLDLTRYHVALVGTQTTFLELVRVILGRPDLIDERADHLLWEHTPFPMLTANGLVPYLRRVNPDACCEDET